MTPKQSLVAGIIIVISASFLLGVDITYVHFPRTITSTSTITASCQTEFPVSNPFSLKIVHLGIGLDGLMDSKDNISEISYLANKTVIEVHFFIPKQSNDQGIGQPWIQLDLGSQLSTFAPIRITVNGSVIHYGWWPNGSPPSIVINHESGLFVVILKSK